MPLGSTRPGCKGITQLRVVVISRFPQARRRRRRWGSVSTSTLEHIGFDLRFAARTLIKAPVFSITAILTLVLGMVPTTAVFTVVNAIILRPLGYPSPERIVLYMTNTPNGTVYGASMTKFNT